MQLSKRSRWSSRKAPALPTWQARRRLKKSAKRLPPPFHENPGDSREDLSDRIADSQRVHRLQQDDLERGGVGHRRRPRRQTGGWLRIQLQWSLWSGMPVAGAIHSTADGRGGEDRWTSAVSVARRTFRKWRGRSQSLRLCRRRLLLRGKGQSGAAGR